MLVSSADLGKNYYAKPSYLKNHIFLFSWLKVLYLYVCIAYKKTVLRVGLINMGEAFWTNTV